MKTKDLVIGLFGLALLGFVGVLWLAPSGLNQMPETTLTNLNGDKVELASFRGKPMVVVFWATTCPSCVTEIPELARLHREYSTRGLTVLGIAMSYDPPGQVREMVRRKQIPYPIVLDTSGEAARQFGDVKLTPTHFLVDHTGRIVQQKLGSYEPADLQARVEALLQQAEAS